jgi:D-alanyl-D-alanine dipeptidase
MYTREDLKEMRSRAVTEANVAHITEEWRHACLDLAAAADHLDALTARIEFGEARAVSDDALRPQQATAG